MKHILNIKRDPLGNYQKHKVRLVICGHRGFMIDFCIQVGRFHVIVTVRRTAGAGARGGGRPGGAAASEARAG